MDALVTFFTNNMPTARGFLVGGPPGLLWAFGCLVLAGRLKRDLKLATGYSRKIYHFLIFGAAAAVQIVWGLPSLCLFGGMVSLAVLTAILCGPGHILYEALARESDAPRRTYYIVVPYVATLVGGLASNVLFEDLAAVGYLVAGLGDAVGEPVGVRFGKHRYRVFALACSNATRTWEGSAAVFAASALALVLALAGLPSVALGSGTLWLVVGIALASAIVEGVSPHGWDNLTMQVVPTALVYLAL